jgi:hypothetical protein
MFLFYAAKVSEQIGNAIRLDNNLSCKLEPNIWPLDTAIILKNLNLKP